MVPEAPLKETEAGIVPVGEGWFVLNAREARWRHREGRGQSLPFEGDADFRQVGINLFVLAPGEPMAMYHWEADQEDFLVLSGEALLIVEGEERPLVSLGLRALPGRDETRDRGRRGRTLRRPGRRSARPPRADARRGDDTRRGLGRLHR